MTVRALMRMKLGAAAGILVAAGLCVPAVQGEQAATYLSAGSFDLLEVLPPAPTKGDARYLADRMIFKKTRKLVGSARWAMAIADLKAAPADMMSDFSCAAGMQLSPASAPRTAALIMEAGRDAGIAANAAKMHYQRQRPFLIDHVPAAQISEPLQDFAGNYDYPSGHATWGWTWAVILAELLPDRASQVLARGRAFGESRVVCGAHNASAVEAARLSASATLTAVRASADYRTDFEAAREELRNLRGTAAIPSGEACRAESSLVAMDILH